MLKALELQGFKSFADKTRFEFPDGITVVVGPNGSGKSNVVDAIRWVLGEQSAKSLRGTEMADVIFKGSGTGQRRPANTAEATIVFDNSNGLLDVESPEVNVTRRVFRSGEGEYRINDEPCRLKDIRSLFRGTGVGTDAYSLIEQGKVDTLLQASPRERRAIFEEAAGISRFKAKKVESNRRLDRVEQNLLRLSDIVDEVDRRLKSLRSQATKARRYQEYTLRLQELRTHVSLSDYRAINTECETVEHQLAQTGEQCEALQSACEQAELDSRNTDTRLETIKDEVRAAASRQARCREEITSLETTSHIQRRTLLDLEHERSQCQRRLATVNSRAGDVQQQLDQVTRELSLAEAEHQQILDLAKQDETTLDELLRQLQEYRDAEQRQRDAHQQQMEAVAKLTQNLNTLESELNIAEAAVERESNRYATLQQELDDARRQEKEATEHEAKLKAQLDHATQQQAQTDGKLRELIEEGSRLTAELSECQQLRSAATERSNVLEEVERRLEGIGAGTKDLLARARSNPIGPLAEVQGMVADLIEVKIEMAPLVDAALGDRAQYIVASGQRLVRAMAEDSIRLRGRVGIIALPNLRSVEHPLDKSLAAEPGIIGHATDFALADESWQELMRHLLGTTWFVHSLDVALRLRDKYARSPWRFVTSAGEVLEPEGTVFGGPRLSSGGIVSRRSELRALQLQLAKFAEQESILRQKLEESNAARTSVQQQHSSWSEQQKATSEEYAVAHARAESARQLVSQNINSQKSLETGIRELEKQRDDICMQQAETLNGMTDLESLVASLETSLVEYQAQLGNLEKNRSEQEQRATETKIKLARLEQQVETLRVQRLQYEQDNEERTRAVSEIATQLANCQQRHRETSTAILTATSKLALVYLQLESSEQQLRKLRAEERRISRDRSSRTVNARKLQSQLQDLQKSQNALLVRAGELRLRRETVVERVRDDYGIELSVIEDELQEQGDREEIEREISELRRKISNIGAVNMESVAELDELESRFGALSEQYNDLIKAKESLERIIHRINADSRKMFVETLNIIRESFQVLFRRAFGGGHADIVVEEGVDILDAGIDIVATPPGKNSLNISLLSGGERAMTAVTLLLAIFRHRPSPFCILDEVDGPLDEANIGRFVDVLREFLATTKVVIVTHSKKTMSAATTLYGVTMQESGVSKRVSVQFNDVSEDGSIRTKDGNGVSNDDGEAA